MERTYSPEKRAFLKKKLKMVKKNREKEYQKNKERVILSANLQENETFHMKKRRKHANINIKNT